MTAVDSRWKAIGKWLRSPELGGVVSALAIASIMLAAGKMLFAPPQLMVQMETNRMVVPSHLNQYFNYGVENGLRQPTPDSVAQALLYVRNFLSATESFVAITLRNTTDHALEDVNVRIRGVRNLTGISFRAELLTSSERDALMQKLQYDEGSHLLVLPQIPSLQGHSSIEIFLWGDISVIEAVGVDPVLASYDGGAGKMARMAPVPESSAFVYRNAALLFLIAIAVNGAVLTYMQRKKSINDAALGEQV
jgi:hypothetical protein